VELAQLEMFVAVVEERNIGRAGDRLFRTQPAVSIALKKLEDQTGTVLLDRARGRALRLTTAGELLYESALRMIAVRDEAVSVLRGEKRICSGRLSIGASGTAALEWLSPLVTKFRAANPAVRIEISSDREPNLLSELVAHDLDAAFFSVYPQHRQTAADLVINRVCAFGGSDDLWLALPKTGRSHILKMFEQMIASELPKTAIGKPPARAAAPSRLGRTPLKAGKRSS
jgi:DNA-binding transcriptional LysR family regulator